MDELRTRAAQGESLDALLPECFAIVRETGKRKMGMRHFDVQMIGGMVLHDGCIAEMKTGEGKTLTATLAVVLNSLAVHRPGSGGDTGANGDGGGQEGDLAEYPDLVDPDAAIDPEAVEAELDDDLSANGPAAAQDAGSGAASAGANGSGGASGAPLRRGVHVVTVNDYLARRDAEWMRPIYDALGVSVGRAPEHAALRGEAARVRVRRDLRDELRAGLRLPARQHGEGPLRKGPARALLRGRGRGRQHPDRRGAHAADHLRGARTGGRPVREVRAPGAADGRGEDARRHGFADEEGVHGGLRLRDRREAQDASRSPSRASRRPRSSSASTTCTAPRTDTWSTT